MEFVYKLKLPSITNLLSSSAENIFVGQDKNFHKTYRPEELLKPEYLFLRNRRWNFINFFYKTNGNAGKGHIHIDGYGGWGINWIYGGVGQMEYWLPENVEIMPAEVDDIGGQVIKCKTSLPPDKIYVMSDGAYLINAWVPHRASGFGRRHALSLRDTNSTESWEEVVNQFSDLII